MFEPKKTFEIFSGGGILGLYDQGYMRRKEECRLTDTDLGSKTHKIGTSIGSFVASWMALGVPSSEISHFITKNTKLLQSIFKPDLKKLIPYFGNKTDECGYFIDNKDQYLVKTYYGNLKSLEQVVSEFIGNETFSDVPDLNIIVSDEEYRKPILLNATNAPQTKISRAILASSAMKPLFPVQKIESDGVMHYCSDGGYTINFGLKYAIEADAKYILGINFNTLGKREIIENPIIGLVDSAFMHNDEQINSLFFKTYNQKYLQFIAKGGVGKLHQTHRLDKPTYAMILNPELKDLHSSDSNQSSITQLIEQGYRDSYSGLEQFLALIK